MQIHTDHKELKQALKRLKPFTDACPSLPILSYVHLAATDGTLRITATKGQNCGCEGAYTSASVLTSGSDYSILVKYADFRKIADKLKADVDLTVRDNMLHLKAGSLSFTLNGKDTDDFPELPSWVDRQIIASSSTLYGDIQAELAFVFCATDTACSKDYTNGVLFDFVPDRLRLIGTDGRRLHSTFPRTDISSADTSSWLVPSEWVKAFNGLKVQADTTVHLEFCDGARLYWRIPDAGISGTVSLLDFPYPDYPKVIPDDCESRFRLNIPETIESLNALSVIATQQDGRNMIVVKANGFLNLSAASETMGTADAHILCDHIRGPEAQFALNVHYFTETLKLADTGILMSNSGELEPVRFDYIETERIAVVMPVRLPD